MIGFEDAATFSEKFILDLTTSKQKIESESNYIGFYWNPQEGKIDENCIFGVEAIIHLAGANIAKRWTNAYKQEVIESRTLSAELLFNLVKKHPNHQIKQIISASGTANLRKNRSGKCLGDHFFNH